MWSRDQGAEKEEGIQKGKPAAFLAPTFLWIHNMGCHNTKGHTCEMSLHISIVGPLQEPSLVLDAGETKMGKIASSSSGPAPQWQDAMQ